MGVAAAATAASAQLFMHIHIFVQKKRGVAGNHMQIKIVSHCIAFMAIRWNTPYPHSIYINLYIYAVAIRTGYIFQAFSTAIASAVCIPYLGSPAALYINYISAGKINIFMNFLSAARIVVSPVAVEDGAGAETDGWRGGGAAAAGIHDRRQAAGSTDGDAAEAAAMWQRTLAPRRPSKEGNSFGSRLPSERFEGKAAKRRELRTAN